MGHRLITQARGKGGPRYRAPSYNYSGKIEYSSPTPNTIRGEVMDIINCVGHSEPIMLIKYETGQVSFLPAALGIRKGEQVYAGDGAPIQLGCVVSLDKVPSGAFVYNLERRPFDGGRMIRTSGTFAQITGREGGMIIVKMPSRKTVAFHPKCRATIGIVAGGGRTEKPWVKGGKHHIARRARGKLHPRSSGVAMNAVDHPFGGTHRRTKGRPSTTKRGTPPGRNIGLLAARKTGRGK